MQKCSNKTKIKIESSALWPSFPRSFILIPPAALSPLASAIEKEVGLSPPGGLHLTYCPHAVFTDLMCILGPPKQHCLLAPSCLKYSLILNVIFGKGSIFSSLPTLSATLCAHCYHLIDNLEKQPMSIPTWAFSSSSLGSYSRALWKSRFWLPGRSHHL